MIRRAGDAPTRGASIVVATLTGTATAAFLAIAGGCAAPSRSAAPVVGEPRDSVAREAHFAHRQIDPYLEGRWIGDAVAYGPFRDGQAPGGLQPTKDEIREDLRLIARHWNLLRIYGATGPAQHVLAVIREERLPLRVLLGIWLAPEERRDQAGSVIESLPAVRDHNHAEIETAVRLANQYADLLFAISVGNETQVSWSDHRIPAQQLIHSIRVVRERTRVPVTTADDYNFWNKPESHSVASEIDFILMHAHPMWNGKTLDEALEWTSRTYAAIRATHSGHTVVLGETGWATARHDQGEQARLIKGVAGETEQQRFYQEVKAWARESGVTTFFFEAFDENWKGGSHPNEVEKHWGLFHSDRTPKRALSAEN